MKKKNILLLTFFVAILFATVIMPNKVMAETEIQQVIYTGTQIYTGNKIPSVVNVETYPAGGIKEKTVPVIWYESDTRDVDMLSLSLSDQLDLSENPTFKENKYYFVERNPLYVFDCNEGYEWADHPLYIYNYRGMTDYDYGKKTTISFIRALTPITEVKMNVSNFTVGKTIGDITLNNITRNPEESKMSDFYKVKLNICKRGTSTKLANDYVLKENEEYEIGIVSLYRGEAYVTTEDTKFYINDKLGTSITNSSGSIVGCFKAETPQNIKEIKYLGVEVQAGNKIPSSVTVETNPVNALTSNTVNLEWFESDTQFENIFDIIAATKVTDTFKEGKYYYCQTTSTLIPKSGYNTTQIIKHYYNNVQITKGLYEICGIKATATPITEIRLIGTEIKPGNALPTTVTVGTVPANGLEETSASVVWYKSDTGTETFAGLTSGMITTGNFENGKYYWVNTERGLTPKSGFEFASSFKVYYNNVEIGTVTPSVSAILNWVKTEEKVYTYKYLSGDNQEFNQGKLNSYTFIIDGDYNKFESLKIGEITFIKDTDYTVTEGSTIITLTTSGIAKLNTLTSGTYDVKTKFTSNTVVGKLMIKDEVKQEENNNTTENKTENNNSTEKNNTTNTDNTENANTIVEEQKMSNPKTGDEIISSVILGIISLICLAGETVYLKKKKLFKNT